MEEKDFVYKAGSRHYYFNCKNTKSGDRYMKIVEYNPKTKERSEIIIWEDHATNFLQSFVTAFEHLRPLD